ncbi:MAG TPA: biotin/lipoyl-containing protein, partial [Acidobacteriota bacterium]|nr:biotin/lipoyl-containing protein [Acidobacteriota bacterium]
MAVEFKLPELGENIESASVIKVLVGIGDRISKDQPVLELETDKATIEVPATVGGVVREIHVKEGGKAMVGQVVLTMDPDGGMVPAAAPAAPAPKAAVPEKTAMPAGKTEAAKPAMPAPAAAPAPAPVLSAQFRIPELGENIDSATVVSVTVHVGDRVERDQTLLELETDKATIEVPSEVAGVVKAVKVKPGEKVSVGQVVMEFSGVEAAAP